MTLLSITFSMNNFPYIEVRATGGVADLGEADVNESLKQFAISKFESLTSSPFPDKHEAHFTLLRKAVGAKIELSLNDDTTIAFEDANG